MKRKKMKIRTNTFQQEFLNAGYLNEKSLPTEEARNKWLKSFARSALIPRRNERFEKDGAQWIAFPLEQFEAFTEERLRWFRGRIEKEQRRRVHVFLNQMIKQGVIKLRSLISFLMVHKRMTKKGAIKFVASVFGISESTQSVYLSYEFEMRQEEQIKTRQKRKLLARK